MTGSFLMMDAYTRIFGYMKVVNDEEQVLAEHRLSVYTKMIVGCSEQVIGRTG